MQELTPRRAMPRVTLTGLALAMACVVTVPFWQEPLLERLQLRTPDNRRLAELTLAADRLTHQVDELQSRLREAAAATQSARGEAVAATRMAHAAEGRLSTLALIQLSAAMRRSGRFETELAMVWAAGGALDDLAPLLERVRPYAAFGIPVLPQLRRDFDTVAARLGRSGDGWGRLAWLVSLVGLARPVPGSGDTTTVLAARVSNLLAEENLAGALLLARQIPDPARGGLADWLDDAGAREAANALARHVATLAGKATGAPP